MKDTLSNKLRKRFTKLLTVEQTNNHHYPMVGFFIIETGRCTILHADASGKKRIVAVIGRNDSFGGAEMVKIAVSLPSKFQFVELRGIKAHKCLTWPLMFV